MQKNRDLPGFYPSVESQYMGPGCSRTRHFVDEAGTLATLKTRSIVYLASLVSTQQNLCHPSQR
jgi:hypothetical protein